MFCRNCGKETPNQGEFCMSCGARPMAGKSFCQACAAPTSPLSEICVKCGTRLIPQTAAPGIAAQTGGVNGKSKTVSILLAVFLGYWTWLYTYKKDHWKFWLSLGLSSLSAIVVVVAIIWGVADGFSSNSVWIVLIIVNVLISIVSCGLWVWSIIDAAIKKDEWYSGYYLGNK